MTNLGITLLVFIVLMIVNYLTVGAFSLEYANVYNFIGISAAVYINREFNIKINKKGIIASAVIIMLTGLMMMYSSEMLNAEKYANLIKTEEKVDVKTLLEHKEIRIISRGMAFKSANKIMGITNKDVILSSQYTIESDNATLQTINGELVWVFPLDYMSFFKWMNQDNIPGYITVSATNNEEQAKLVLKDFKIGFNGFFNDRAERVSSFASGLKLVDTHFEVDENGKPYYIGLIKTPKIGVKGYVVEKGILIDANNGNSEILTIKEMEEKYPWIDNLIIEELTLEQITYKGLFSDGWLNAYINQNNVKKPTDDYLTTVSAGGQLWSFTGMTSMSSKDQSLIEGIFVNNKTGVATILSLPEITNEDGAIQQMESSLGSDSIKWKVILPQPLIVNGEFYWLGTVVSNANLFQKVMAVDGKNVSKVFEAKDVENLIRKIKNDTNDETENKEETIVIKKSVYNKILKLNADFEELKKELQIK